ncbi:MAG: hypothetical protein ACO3EP_02845 [Phycisphaerales bacterium]|jgi:hypothetical protein
MNVRPRAHEAESPLCDTIATSRSPRDPAGNIPARLLSATALFGIMHVAAADPPPCPPFVEIPCVDPAGGDGDAGTPPIELCTPGPGAWTRSPIERQITPTEPHDRREEFSMGWTRWTRHEMANGSPSHASVSLSLSGQSIFQGIGSQAAAIAASFQSRIREYWEGPGPAAPRLLALEATGFAGMSIAVSCAASSGCSATASATAAGGCSSVGSASAILEPRSIDATAIFNTESSRLQFEGNVGAMIDDSGPTMSGEVSRDSTWSTQGVGSASGGASYVVRPERTYCAFTNRPCVRRAFGTTSVALAGTVDAGSTASAASAVVGFDVH